MKYLFPIFLLLLTACGEEETELQTLQLTEVSFAQNSYSITEGSGEISVRVVRSSSFSDLSVDYVVTAGSAIDGEDYSVSAQAGTLNFNTGVNFVDIPISILDDVNPENMETFNLQLSNPSEQGLLAEPSITTVSILDNDSAGQLQFSTAAISRSEASGTTQINVLRNGGVAPGVSVDYQISPGTATAGLDYDDSVLSGTLQFGTGETNKTIDISLIDDALAESAETLFISLSNASGGATIGTTDTLTVTITDNDMTAPVEINFSQASYSVTENSGVFALTLNRSTGAGTASVDYTITAVTATEGLDYSVTANSGTVNFAQSESSKTIPITIIDDALDEGVETITVQLSNPSDAILISPSTATLSITDNDTGGSIQFSSASDTVDEAVGVKQISVVRSNGVAAGVSVDYQITPGTATPGLDYDDTVLSGTLVFAAGDSSKNIDLNLIDDALVEPGETLNITLSNALGGAAIGAIDTYTLNITDNDVEAAGDISFSQAVYAVTENTGVLQVIVNRTNGTLGNVTVDYSVTAGSATAASDYTVTVANGTITFDAAQTSQSIPVTIVDDTLAEGVETLSLQLSNPSSGATVVTPSSATVSITDNDSGGQIQFSNTAMSRDESSGTSQMTVERSNGVAAGVTIDYLISPGTATPGADYDSTTVSGTLVFAADELSRSIDVTLFDDAIDENTETIILSLSNPQGGASLGAISSLTLSIIDNDTAPVSGSSLSFVGVDLGTQQEYATQTDLPADFGVGEFSFQMWVKLDDSYPVGPTPSDRTDSRKAINWSDADNAPYSSNDWWWQGNFLLDGHNNGTFANGTFSIQIYGGGRVRWLFGDGGSYLLGVQAYPANTTPSLLDGLWHQITLIRRWSGNSSLLELWVDGMQIATETSSRQTNMRQYWDTWSQFINGQPGWFWGAEKNAAVGGYTYEDYKGLVDEVRLWSRALSGSEIASTYNQAATGTEPGLVGLYRLDDGSGLQSCNIIDTTQCINMIVPQQGWGVWDQENAPLQ